MKFVFISNDILQDIKYVLDFELQSYGMDFILVHSIYLCGDPIHVFLVHYVGHKVIIEMQKIYLRSHRDLNSDRWIQSPEC